MSEPIVPLETDEALQRAVERIGAGPLAVDTEADSFHSYRERVCLVQMTYGGEDVIVDPLAGVDLSALAAPLADPSIRTILHAADYDLRLLQRDHGLEVRGLFDTMIAARLVGERRFGLAPLLEANFGIAVDKSMQRADWSKRPLTPAMLDYAARDTRHLEALADRLERRLEGTGRTAWAREEFERLELVRWSEDEDREPGFRRVRGSGRLVPRELAVLRALWEVRDAHARSRDVAVFRVMRDDALLELARRAPATRDDLQRIGVVPRPWRRGERAASLLDAIERAMALSDDELPQREERRSRRPPPEVEARVKALAKRRDELAERLEIESPLIAPRRVLEALLEAREQDRDPAAVDGLRRWQAELLLPLLD